MPATSAQAQHSSAEPWALGALAVHGRCSSTHRRSYHASTGSLRMHLLLPPSHAPPTPGTRRYLLSLDGITASSRLSTLLAINSLTLKQARVRGRAGGSGEGC